MALGSIITVITFIASDVYREASKPEIYVAEASETVVVPDKKEVLIEVEIDWDNKQRIVDEIKKVFPETPNTAVAIAKCESGLNPEATNTSNKNGTIDRGIMQINSIHDTNGYDLYDVQDNLEFARKLYEESGWQPWVCYTRGYWKKHI